MKLAMLFRADCHECGVRIFTENNGETWRHVPEAPLAPELDDHHGGYPDPRTFEATAGWVYFGWQAQLRQWGEVVWVGPLITEYKVARAIAIKRQAQWIDEVEL